MPYIPHTKSEVAEMLSAIGVNEVENLFDEIPPALRSNNLDTIPSGINELQLSQLVKEKLKSISFGKCYIGAGAYEHHIPACVWELTSRGEFLTAYTPYQAEASQGTLQLLYEFQTMMAKLTGMDVSNASLYDGGSALAEAVLMAVRINKKSKSKRILMIHGVHPHYIETTKTIVSSQGIELVSVKIDELVNYELDDVTAVVIQQPTFLGSIEDVDFVTCWAHKNKAKLIASVNPMSLALLKPPGEWGDEGADVVCGEGQSMGVPLASGGPYFGFLTTKQAFVRQLPGRLIGRTIDLDGKEGFSLTLQAREQHIRRSKATSNICTNQGLLVTASTIYMSLMGQEGLVSVAKQCHLNTQKLLQKIIAIDGVALISSKAFFHEIAIQLPVSVNEVLSKMHKDGIEAGLSLKQYYPELGEALLICVTETKTDADLEEYALCLEAAIKEVKQCL